MPAFYDIPLDLPHAYTIATRIMRVLEARSTEDSEKYDDLVSTGEAIVDLLWAYSASGENPPEPESTEVRDRAAELGRALVDQIEALGAGGDRLGQHVRNFFECLALGEEGAAISLRAGEDPASLQRPY